MADRRAQGRIGHQHIGPHRIEQLLAADNPVTVPHQVAQQLEVATAKLHDLVPRRTQQACTLVKLEIGEPMQHGLSTCI